MSYKYAACLASSKTGNEDLRCSPDENWSQYFQRRLAHCGLPKSEKDAQVCSDESGSAGLGPLLSLLFDENNPEQQETNCRDAVQLAQHLIIVGSALFACSHFVADLVHSFLKNGDRRVIFVIVGGETSKVLEMYHPESQRVEKLWVLSPTDHRCLNEMVSCAGSILLGGVKDFDKVQDRNLRELDLREDGAPASPSVEERLSSSGSDHTSLRAAEGVTFSTFAPCTIATGQTFIIDLWAHTSQQTDCVLQEAKSVGRDRKLGVKAGVQISRGSILALLLEIPTMHIRDPMENLSWNGVPSNASFIVKVPVNATRGPHAARIAITTAGIPLAKLSFTVEVGTESSPRASLLPTMLKQMRTAFASYSSRDRAEVFARVQGMKKIRPELEVFLDVLSLRSGQDWEAQLNRYLPSRDVFFLFWSRHAKQSTEVEKEWRLALKMRGLDYIDPVPLCDPKESPPPAELQGLHFNDLYLSYIKASRSRYGSNKWWKLW